MAIVFGLEKEFADECNGCQMVLHEPKVKTNTRENIDAGSPRLHTTLRASLPVERAVPPI